jgi:acyl-homoserine lactone acylase PvdQ
LRIGTFPYPGDNDTVNGGYFIFSDGRYPVMAGAASRLVVDLARPSGAWFNCSTGMAGEPSSPYFKNLTQGWYHDQYFRTPLAQRPEDVPDGKRLMLVP